MIKKNSFLVNKTELNFHTYVNKILKILFWIKTKEIVSSVNKVGSEYLFFSK